MLLSKYTACESKKSNLIKEQEASGLLSSLEIKAPLSKFSLVGPLAVLFNTNSGFIYSACRQKTKNDSKNLKKQEIHNMFIKMNKIRLVFNMTWHMNILKI